LYNGLYHPTPTSAPIGGMKLFKPFLDELRLKDLLFPLFLFPYLTLPLNLKPDTYPSPHLSYFSFFLFLVFLWHFFFLSLFFLFFLHYNVGTISISIIVVRKGALRKRGKGVQYNDTIVESARQRQGLLSSIGSLLTVSQHKEGKIVCTLCVCPTSIHHHQGEKKEKKGLVKECLCVFLGLSHIYVPIIEKKKGKGW